MSVLEFSVRGVGVVGPGLPDWPASRTILAAMSPYQYAPMINPAPDILPAAERRRASASVRLALAAALEATRASALDPKEVASVFAARDSDGQILHEICDALAQSQRQVSPTRFHNSVHNAPSGYWSIGAGSHAASNSLGAYDLTFAAGLLEAVVQVAMENQPVLLVAFDLPMPQPLHAMQPMDNPFAAAFMLAPMEGGGAQAPWRLTLEPAGERRVGMPSAPKCLRNNPISRCWPWLTALARGQSSTDAESTSAMHEVLLEYFDAQVLVLRSGS